MDELNTLHDNVMQDKIKEWKAAQKNKHRNLDFEMLTEILRVVNDSSAVKIARNPLDKDHDWIHGTECFNIGKAEVDDEGCLVLTLRHDNTECSVDKLLDVIHSMRKQTPSRASKVKVRITETKTVEITDAYSHALMKDHWAGLPSDLVLAYYEDDEKKDKAK